MREPHPSSQGHTSGFLSSPFDRKTPHETSPPSPGFLCAFQAGSQAPLRGLALGRQTAGRPPLSTREACSPRPPLGLGGRYCPPERCLIFDLGSAFSLLCDPALGYLQSLRVSLPISKMGLIRAEPACGVVWGINRDAPHISQCWARGPLCVGSGGPAGGARLSRGWGGSALCPLPSEAAERTTAVSTWQLWLPALRNTGHRPVSFSLLVPFPTPFPCPPCREHLCVQQAELDYLSGRHKDTHRNSRLVRPLSRLPAGAALIGVQRWALPHPLACTVGANLGNSESQGMDLLSRGMNLTLGAGGKPPSPPNMGRVQASEDPPPFSLWF